jgi:hypothetical protein
MFLDILGLLGMIVYIACIIGLAASVTWVVVRYSPMKRPKEPAR